MLQQKNNIIDKVSDIAHCVNVKLTARLLLFKSKVMQEMPLLKISFFSVFLWGILAHGYMFASHALSHDSLTEFESALYSNYWKFSGGRFIAPLYRALFRSSVTVPWTIGILALLWCTLTLWLLCKSYKISSKWQIFLLGGCLTTNICFISMTATYIHDLDQNMFALLSSAVAVFLWKEYRRGWLIGSLFVTISLGLYQAFISVIATLLLLDFLMMLNKGYDLRVFFKKVAAAAGMVMMGGFIYFVLLKVVPFITKVPLSSGEYNSLGSQEITVGKIVWNLGLVYGKVFKHLFYSPTNYSLIFIAVLKIALLAAAIYALFAGQNNKVRADHRWLMLPLCLLLPIPLQIPLLIAGFSHDLMLYSFCIVYIGVIILLFNVRKCRTLVQTFCFAAFFIIGWSNVQTANSLYVRKRLEYDAVHSYMTRVLDKIENFQGYERGKTKVVFIGHPTEFYQAPSWKKYHELTGVWRYTHMSVSKEWFDSYIKYFMHNKLELVDSKTFKKINKEFEPDNIPCFPDPKSIFMHKGILVVKIGKSHTWECP